MIFPLKLCLYLFDGKIHLPIDWSFVDAPLIPEKKKFQLQTIKGVKSMFFIVSYEKTAKFMMKQYLRKSQRIFTCKSFTSFSLIAQSSNSTVKWIKKQKELKEQLKLSLSQTFVCLTHFLNKRRKENLAGSKTLRLIDLIMTAFTSYSSIFWHRQKHLCLHLHFLIIFFRLR